MPFVCPSRPRSARACRTRGTHGFTLIELLTAMAIIAILTSLSVGLFRSSKQRAAVALARGEIAVLNQALETYKQHYGDYPQTGNAPQATPLVGADVAATQAQALLFNALLGVYGPSDFATLRNGPVLVELSKVRLEPTRDYTTRVNNNTFGLPSGSPPAKPRVASAFLDPWGNRYLYYYKQAPIPGRPATNVWQAGGYLLYSAGPDGQHTAPNITTGLFNGTTQTTGVNADNVFSPL